ncbi:trigger factor, partial [Candidatus Peregrinibacteria bacterium CG_4_9_14_0_2_um_filter_41_14]
AIKQEKVEPITKPQIEVKSVEPLEFDAKVALMPEVKLNNITKIKIKREKQKIEKDELDGTIYELRKYQATYKDIDRDAKIGDRAEIDFEGFEEDDTTLDNTASKNYPIVIGDNAFVPGFEENLIGMKTGDKKEFVITFPKDYHRKDFQNKKVKFKVSLNRLEEMQLPEVNKEFSKKIIGKELDEKEFIEAIKTDILRQKESKEDQRQQAKLFEEIAKQADINMSSLIVDEELDYMLHQQKHELEQRGIKWEEFLKSMDEKKRDIREERKDEAEQRVKVRLALRDIIKEKDLAVKDEEVLAKLKEFNQSKADLTPNSGAFKQVKDQLLLEKVFNEFLEKSVA